MKTCTRKCALILSTIITCIGIILVFFAEPISKKIITNILILEKNSEIFQLWKHFPEQIPFEVYLYNWTNAEEIYNNKVKPKFELVGPFMYTADLDKSNLVWNSNNTVTFKQSRTFFYKNGNLEANITNVNIIYAGIAKLAQNYPYVVKKGISMTLSTVSIKLISTFTVDELLFKGFELPFTAILSALPSLFPADMPKFSRFGWFYTRNGTGMFDGPINVGTGLGTTIGQIYQWYYNKENKYFEKGCSKIKGSSGELFPNPGKTIEILISEFCRSVVLEFDSTIDFDGVTALKYSLNNYMTDDGTLYPEKNCSCSGDCLPVGVLNASQCVYGLPSYVSLPNFYRADPFYRNAVELPELNTTQMEFYIIIEPITGIPLEVQFGTQANVRLEPISGIKFSEDAPTLMVPAMFSISNVVIPKKNFEDIRKLLKLSFYLKVFSICVVVLSIVLFVLFYRVKSVRIKTNKLLEKY